MLCDIATHKNQIVFNYKIPVMVSPRGQAGLQAKFLSSASKTCPRPLPRAFGLGLSSNFLFWPSENA